MSRNCPTCGQRLRRERNVEQNALYWRLLNLIASNLRPEGQVFDPKCFHEYYKQKFLPCTDIRLPNGKVVVQTQSTTELSVEEFSDYFESVQEDARDRGVVLPPDPYKEW